MPASDIVRTSWLNAAKTDNIGELPTHAEFGAEFPSLHQPLTGTTPSAAIWAGLLEKHLESHPELLNYRGQSVGNSALHWAAAKVRTQLAFACPLRPLITHAHAAPRTSVGLATPSRECPLPLSGYHRATRMQ
eukprot:SAG22_NODE_4037_length_1413_cov_1.307458_2_plen_133_part_00